MTNDDKAQNWCSEKLPCARYEALSAENERLREALERQQHNLNHIAWLAQLPYDPNEQLTDGYTSEGQAGSEA